MKNYGFEDVFTKENKTLSYDITLESNYSVDKKDKKKEHLILTGRGKYLDDIDIIKYIVGKSTKRSNIVDTVSNGLILRFNSFAKILTRNQNELQSIKEISIHIITSFKIIQEAALRYNQERIPYRDIINNEDKLIDYLNSRLSRENIEQFRIIFLNQENVLLADEAQARGTVNHTPVYPREVVRRALELKASALILVHNHPSGDPTPSKADLDMTQHIYTALQIVDIKLVDHFNIGNGRHISFRKERLANFSI